MNAQLSHRPPRERRSNETASAQRLRLQRMTWGYLLQSGTALMVIGLFAFGLVAGLHTLVFLGASVMINAGFVVLVRTGLNLRFRDPSMTMAQILLTLLPAVYVMFHVQAPAARVAFLLMGTGGLLFGMLGMTRRQMFAAGAVIVGLYLALLVALRLWAPERIDLRVEAVVVLAYSAVLGVVSYLGSFIAGLRKSLSARNHELEEALERLHHLATRDELTGLPNRRSIWDQLRRERSRVERAQDEIGRRFLGIVILDVDHFKDVNDTYGHHVGDRVLRALAEALQASIRTGDFLGRFGGEEFVLVFPETTAADLVAVTERARVAIESLEIPGIASGGSVTVSQGVAVHRAGEPVEATLRRADAALYRAKDTGRNRVVVADDLLEARRAAKGDPCRGPASDSPSSTRFRPGPRAIVRRPVTARGA